MTAKKETSSIAPIPRCAAIAESGINTTQQAVAFMSALVADISTGRVTPNVANSTCNAMGKMIRIVELEAKFGYDRGVAFVRGAKRGSR